jgi:hypothetical protein
MDIFEKAKEAVSRALHIGEDEAHRIVTALEPLLVQLKTELETSVKAAVVEAVAGLRAAVGDPAPSANEQSASEKPTAK